MKNFKLIYTVGVILLSVLLTLAIASLILAVLGADVLKTFWVIFCYPFTTFKNISGVINIMTPLTLVGVGICVAYRSGIINIGGEGQMLFGLLCAIVFALYSGLEGAGSIPLIMLAGMIGGAVWGFFPGSWRTWRVVSSA